MSASQEKKNRASMREEGIDKRANAAAEKAKKDRKFRRNVIIAAIIVVVVIAAAFVIDSNLFYTGTTAVRVGDTNYNAAQVNCFYEMAYNTVYNTYYQQYGQYTSYFLDPSRPLDEQQYTNDQTWAEYLNEATVANMKQITALYDEAVKNGYVLSEDDKAAIESNISTLSIYAANNGYQNLSSFLAANYGGKGVTEKLYREVLTRSTIASSYAAQLRDSYTYTDAQLKDYYAAHKDDLDYFYYLSYLVKPGRDAYADLEGDAKTAAIHDDAQKLADAAAALGNEGSLNARRDSFDELVAAQMGEGEASVPYNSQGQDIADLYRTWLLDASRQPGDATVIDAGESGSYVLCFLERSANDYNLVSMRHVLFSATADENGEYTEEALESAKAEAQDLYDLWQEEPTEENFAAMANTYSDDTGSNTNGGLYENIPHHQMVDAIDEFLFDPARQSGDHALVPGSSGSYSGWHIVYFVGANDMLFCDELSDAALRDADYSSALTALETPYSVTNGFAYRFTKLA